MRTVRPSAPRRFRGTCFSLIVLRTWLPSDVKPIRALDVGNPALKKLDELWKKRSLKKG